MVKILSKDRYQKGEDVAAGEFKNAKEAIKGIKKLISA